VTDRLEIAPQSLTDLKRLGEAYKAGEKDLQKRVRDGLRLAAKPLAADVVRSGAARMPNRGGLRARIAAARGGVTVGLGGRNVSVSIRVTDRQKDSIKGLDTGTLRHPVYGRGAWVSQQVPAHAFTDAFNANRHHAETAVNTAVQKALDDVARRA
jgi:hypothetical protein